MQNETELKIDLNLPNHEEELYEAELKITELRQELLTQKKKKELTKKQYNHLRDEITRVLYYVGSLSMPAFEVDDYLENEYHKVYSHAPELAKKLWQDHYGRIHRPYNILKNRLFRMYDDLDKIYLDVNKKEPLK